MSDQNHLLSLLLPADTAALRPHLRSVRLEQHLVLFDIGDIIQTVIFPTTALVSLVVPLSSGEAIEAAMVGRDGVVSAASAMDGKAALNRGIIQLSGNALQCDTLIFKAIALQSHTLMEIIFAHEQTAFAQAQQSAACNIAHSLEARLARWLLRARDLVGSDSLHFTQEFLSQMIGAGRPSVSIAAHTLQSAGMIKYRRGTIQITNAEALQETACECYDTVRANYASLLRRM
jgi:CRP-like cAMP-binding protein